MPGQDKTGPQGMGALTGRGLGPCGNGIRRGFSCRGFGFRARCSTPVNLTKEEEKKILEEDLKEIESEKESIKKRLEDMN